MKKSLLTLMLTIVASAMMAQQPVITYPKTTHDFGKINEADGRVTTVFEFKNEGMAPLVLSNVRASCGCTQPKYPKEPIEPGQTGQISVTYNPNGRPGRFQKTITVTSNATEPTTKLYIKGEVIPKPAQPVNEYLVQMGDLSLKTKTVNFGIVKKGDKAQREIEYANHTDHTITVDMATLTKDAYLYGLPTLTTIEPKQSGKFLIGIDSELAKVYGPVRTNALVTINDKHEKDYAIAIVAEIVEDFSNLTTEQLQLAPIAQINKDIDLGTVKAGQALKKAIAIYNNGSNLLYVRRLYSNHDNVYFVAPKAIKSGKKGDIKLEIKTANLKPNAYTYQMQVYTNDPKNHKQYITLRFKVEE